MCVNAPSEDVTHCEKVSSTLLEFSANMQLEGRGLKRSCVPCDAEGCVPAISVQDSPRQTHASERPKSGDKNVGLAREARPKGGRVYWDIHWVVREPHLPAQDPLRR